MKELINQRNEMSAINMGSHTTYKRMRSRHDDLFMSKLIGINAIILWWNECEERLV